MTKGGHEISQGKAAAIALNTLQLTFWQNLCGEDSSSGLDDQQVEGQDYSNGDI